MLRFDDIASTPPALPFNPLSFARGSMMPLNRHVERSFKQSRKDTHWEKEAEAG